MERDSKGSGVKLGLTFVLIEKKNNSMFFYADVNAPGERRKAGIMKLREGEWHPVDSRGVGQWLNRRMRARSLRVWDGLEAHGSSFHLHQWF